MTPARSYDRGRDELFDYKSKRSGVVSYPRISRHDRHQLRRLAEQFCRCEMHRIQRADRLYGKRTPDTREHRIGDGDDETPTREYSQPSHGRAFLLRRQAIGRSSADDRSCGFRECECRSHLPSFGSYRLQGRRVAFQERRKQGA